MSTTWLIVILVLLALAAFLYKFFTNPYFFARVMRFFLRFRYRVTLDGFAQMMNADPFLLMPNHPAYIDPMLLFTEMYARNRKVSPMTDEQFFKNPVFRQILSLGDAVVVPDLMKNRSAAAVNQASQLVSIAVDALAEGRSIVFYPSGHVTLDGLESIGYRRMAYETMRAISQSSADSPLRNVQVFMLRSRGLETSRWAKSRRKILDENGKIRSNSLPWTFVHPKWYQRRKVTLHFENMTETLLLWAQENDKAEFNRKLEEWYNAT